MWKRISFQLEAVDVTIDCNFLILFDRRKFEKKRFDIRSVGEYFGMEEQNEQKRSNDYHFSMVVRYNLLLRGLRKFARETVRIGK